MYETKKAYEILKTAYEQIFSTPEKRKYYCPIKKVTNLKRVDGASVERRTILPAKTIDNIEGEKVIYVNDENGEYNERVRIGDIIFENKKITTFRCGIMTCIAISQFVNQMNLKFDNVGFIGCGRTNIQNCKAIKEVFGTNKAVIRGSKGNYGKNIEVFKKITNTVVDDSPDFKKLNECDIVVVTTSNFKKENLISIKDLPKPKLFIVLDCGYTLDETFRKDAICYTDYKEQIESDYEDEFPFDKKKHDLLQLVEENYDVAPNKRICVYLHGIGFADVMIADMKVKGVIS